MEVFVSWIREPSICVVPVCMSVFVCLLRVYECKLHKYFYPSCSAQSKFLLIYNKFYLSIGVISCTQRHYYRSKRRHYLREWRNRIQVPFIVISSAKALNFKFRMIVLLLPCAQHNDIFEVTHGTDFIHNMRTFLFEYCYRFRCAYRSFVMYLSNIFNNIESLILVEAIDASIEWWPVWWQWVKKVAYLVRLMV